MVEEDNGVVSPARKISLPWTSSGHEVNGGDKEGGDWKSQLLVARGRPLPLGVSAHDEGTNFAVYTRESDDVHLVLFPSRKRDDDEDSRRVEIALDRNSNKTGQVWHVLVSPYLEGFEYMFRIGREGTGKYAGRLVIDPLSYALDTPRGADSFNNYRVPYRPRSVIPPKSCGEFDWEGVLPPRRPLKNLVIYEMHVRGFTRSPDSDAKAPGTFIGVLEKIPHLKSLGVNCVELLPVFEFNETEWDRVNPYTNRRLCQYWGYNTVNFFSPMNRYAVGKEPWSAVEEFKTMVRELHRARIEVILDVVFNHTAEFGDNGLGPAFFHFKGLSVDTYYIRKNGKFCDFTGCGNSVSLNNPIVADWFHQCIRYWVHEMGVDGFRFDLASTLTRDAQGNPMSSPPAIERISKDPSLRDTKFIAEPWDCGGLYQVGSFPDYGVWAEWNGKFRDALRSFLKGDQKTMSEFATRMCGSEDLYGNGRHPWCSINFVVAHDGFSLMDLVSYNDKHNMENGESNRDGESHNTSWNCGVEGDTGEQNVRHLRQRQCRNFIVALMLAAGTPMVLMGDEYGRSCSGNNNGWCQDQQKSYVSWKAGRQGGAEGLFRFTSGMIKFRRAHTFLQRDDFIRGDAIKWHGTRPNSPQWQDMYNFLAFTMIDRDGGEDLYAAFNAGNRECTVVLPDRQDRRKWCRIVDTNLPPPNDFVDANQAPLTSGTYRMASYSCILLKAMADVGESILKRVDSLKSNSSVSSVKVAAAGGLGGLNFDAHYQQPQPLRESASSVSLSFPEYIPRSMSRFDVTTFAGVFRDSEDEANDE